MYRYILYTMCVCRYAHIDVICDGHGGRFAASADRSPGTWVSCPAPFPLSVSGPAPFPLSRSSPAPFPLSVSGPAPFPFSRSGPVPSTTAPVAGLIPAAARGTELNVLLHAVDIFPTIAAVANVSLPVPPTSAPGLHGLTAAEHLRRDWAWACLRGRPQPPEPHP
jgi:hypothetical protein